MARVRKASNRYWSKENNISGVILRNWIMKYNKYRENSLVNKKSNLLLSLLLSRVNQYNIQKEISLLKFTET